MDRTVVILTLILFGTIALPVTSTRVTRSSLIPLLVRNMKNLATPVGTEMSLQDIVWTFTASLKSQLEVRYTHFRQKI